MDVEMDERDSRSRCLRCRERRVRCDGGRSPGCSACVRKARWDGRNIDTDLGCYYKEPASNSPSSPPSPPVASCSAAASTSHVHSHDQEQKPFVSSSTTTLSKKPLSRRAARKPKGSTPPAEQPAAPLQKGVARSYESSLSITAHQLTRISLLSMDLALIITGLACIACKARRVKCSGSKPACDSCVRNARWNGRCPDTEHGCVYRADLPRKTPYHPAHHQDLAEPVQEPFLSASSSSRTGLFKRSNSCALDTEEEEGEEEEYYSEEASFGDESVVGAGESLGIDLGVGIAAGLMAPPGEFNSIVIRDKVACSDSSMVHLADGDVKPMIIPGEEEFDPSVSPSAATEDPTFSLSASDVLLSEPEFVLPHPTTELTFSSSPRLVPSLYASSSTTDTSFSCPSPMLASPLLSPLGTPHAFFGHDLALVSYPPMPYPPASYWTEVRLPPPPPMFELDWDALRLDAGATDGSSVGVGGEDPMMLGSFKGTGMFGKEMHGVGGAGLETTSTGVVVGDVHPITVDPRMTMMHLGSTGAMGNEAKVEEERWKKELGDLMNDDVTREWGL
ncbi:BQ2448_6305 [Microbotryum intermedium]|uniref:BQ2448_6305 protein n=1 Tax=Microbotryum intermedium TaxID=269621 RepID=A0A238FL38_9BASI|nr:BQ2448_6305 [Microbotryum intermedium]